MRRCIRWQRLGRVKPRATLQHSVSHNYIINPIVQRQPWDEVPPSLPLFVPKAAETGSFHHHAKQIPTRCNYSGEMLSTRRSEGRRRRGSARDRGENLSSLSVFVTEEFMSNWLSIIAASYARKEETRKEIEPKSWLIHQKPVRKKLKIEIGKVFGSATVINFHLSFYATTGMPRSETRFTLAFASSPNIKHLRTSLQFLFELLK